MSRPLRLPPRRVSVQPKKLDTDPVPPPWPSFQGDATYVGTSGTGRCHVFYDASLGTDGLTNAQDLVNDADRVIALNDAFFAASQGETFVLVYALGGMTDGTGGADHMGCDYVSGNAIEVCASFGNAMRISGLFEAELSECNMGGSLCGASTGEALSRWCASAVSSNALSDFASAPTWFSDGAANWVDNVEPTDQDVDGTGCGMAFISWLLSQGYTLAQIAQALVALGDGGLWCVVYGNLTGDDAGNAWTKFSSAINGLPYGVTSDDPFGQVS